MTVWPKMDSAPETGKIVGLDSWGNQAIIWRDGEGWTMGGYDDAPFYPIRWTEAPEVDAETVAEIQRENAEREAETKRQRAEWLAARKAEQQARAAEYEARQAQLRMTERGREWLASCKPLGSGHESD